MANRLAAETSPYLLQHADNPVDWYPWGDDAFARAVSEDRPILLSVGYSACHWCHVMAHESFEDERIAALMNELFVNIKVDREERPDVDSIYMQAVMAISGHGGWPMTVFLTPEGVPYFGGTYFPPTDRHGMRGFDYVLTAVSTVYRDRREEVAEAAAQLRRALDTPPLPPGSVASAKLDDAAGQLVAQTNARQGGFGDAPKFPHPGALDFLLRRHRVTGERRFLDAALLTLDRMDRGGIHDQVGGGFHRYAVDATWSIPHFEKMLYDNAQLARVYVHAFQLTGNERWRRVAEDTLDHALRELRVDGGGFASSQDADSPGGEGSYFVWTPTQLDEVLDDEDGALAARVFGVTATGNFHDGTTVLSQPFPIAQVARSLDIDEAALTARVDSIRTRLLEARNQRVAPARDDKVIVAWNALMVSALADAGAALGRADYVDSARQCADFLLGQLRPDGVLLRTWKDGVAKIPAFLADYAFLADALISLHEACGEGSYVATAQALLDETLRRFEDGGVVYDTASDAERLLVRPRTIEDNPIPAGQSVLASALLRLAALTGQARYRETASMVMGPIAPVVGRSPLAVSTMASAMDRAQARSREVAISGSPEDPRTVALVAAVHRTWSPNTVLAWGDADVALLADRPLVDGRPAAYVCERFACQLPVTEPEELAALLG